MASSFACGPREGGSCSRGAARRAASGSRPKGGVARRRGAGFRADERLHTGAEYQRVFRGGRRQDGRFFLMLAASNRTGAWRLGLAVGRRLGGAVERNRAKRLLRECFRRNRPAGGRGQDLVLVAKPGILGCGLAEVEREYRERLRRVLDHARAGLGRDPDPGR